MYLAARRGAAAAVAVDTSHGSDIHTTAAMASIKTPYTMIVRRNIARFLLKTKLNIKKFYTDMEENLTPAFPFHQEDEIIDEVEQNRANEELELSLAAA